MLQKYLRRILFNRRAAFIHDLLWVPTALLLSYWFRFNLDEIPPNFLKGFWFFCAISLPVYAFIFWVFGLYRGLWRFASLPDLSRIVKSVTLGSLIVALIAAILFRLEGVPRSVLLLTPLLLTLGLAAPRLYYRWFKDRRLKLLKVEVQRTLIVGAGHAGELLIRDLIHKQEFLPVAFVDDDTKKHGREIHGVRVYGGCEDIGTVCELFDVEIALLAIPSATVQTIKRIVAECVKIGIKCKTLPTLPELDGHRVNADQLRSLTLSDLLGRDAVTMDQNAIAGYLKGKSVLVTGGGGSIGSELCRQVAKQHPARLIILENGEFNLYSIEHELRADFPDLQMIVVLGDVKNRDRVDWVFKKFRPDVIYHAAAYKHVPMLEMNPAEGVSNNIIGTKIVADAADRYGSDRFVFVSTDKAVNPENVMGTTKRIAEIYCQNLNFRSSTRFITTRFGNVLGSAGSVVPLFEKQIKNGGPVTVTHPEIRRYFMTIPESASLILQAGSMGEGGEIFVLDMGKPILIKDLAEQMIRLSGFEPDRDIAIKYTGLRLGEKLFEEIFHESENLRGTVHPKLLLAGCRKCSWQWLTNVLDDLNKAAISRNVPLLIFHLRAVVPEYSGLHISEKAEKDERTVHLKAV